MGCNESRDQPDTSSVSEFSDIASSDNDSYVYLANRKRKKQLAERNRELFVYIGDPERGDAIQARIRAVILTPTQRAIACDAFWRLGENKWKECMDRLCWPQGRFAIDSSEDRREPGFLASMHDAWCYASSEIGYKSTAESWFALNVLANAHRPSQPGLRTKNSARRGFVAKEAAISSKAVKEFQEMPKKLCRIKPLPLSERYSHECKMPGIKRKTMRAYLNRYIHEFYKSVGCLVENHGKVHNAGGIDAALRATDPDLTRSSRTVGGDAELHWKDGTWPPPQRTVVEALAVLHQRLSRMQPSLSGNTRTMMVLLNKLLCDCGLHPLLMDEPNAAAYRTLDEHRMVLDRELEAWETLAQESLRPESSLNLDNRPFDAALREELFQSSLNNKLVPLDGRWIVLGRIRRGRPPPPPEGAPRRVAFTADNN